MRTFTRMAALFGRMVAVVAMVGLMVLFSASSASAAERTDTSSAVVEQQGTNTFKTPTGGRLNVGGWAGEITGFTNVFLSVTQALGILGIVGGFAMTFIQPFAGWANSKSPVSPWSIVVGLLVVGALPTLIVFS